MATRKTTAEKIDEQRAKMAEMENEIKRLMQQQKKEERTARSHRLCSCGGKVEKLLPGLITLTDEQFEIFVQKTLLTGFAEKILRQLSPPLTESTDSNGGADTVQGGETPAPKPAVPPQTNTASGTANAPNAVTRTS
jgi:hypothetical protein